MKYIITLTLSILSVMCLHAQINTKLPIDTAKQRAKGSSTLTVGSGGIKVTKDNITINGDERDTTSGPLEVQFGMLDLGVNSLIDNTNYNFTQYHLGFRNPPHTYDKDLFSLRQSKSINVNIYPIMLKAKLYRTPRQRWTLATGLGLQLYNFRFTKPISYRSSSFPYVVMDTVSFSKNKLAFNYLMMPLMLNGKTKIGGRNYSKATKGNSTYGDGYWLTYGVGISGGYLLSSWTKQISDERGKEKNHDPFNFRKTNFCVNGELGLDGYVRLYASYQLTALHTDVLDQHPFCIGLRFLGL